MSGPSLVRQAEVDPPVGGPGLLGPVGVLELQDPRLEGAGPPRVAEAHEAVGEVDLDVQHVHLGELWG